MALTIQQLCKSAFDQAASKGWHDVARSFGDDIALITSELSEALEAYRDGYHYNYTEVHEGKPEGIPSELADACIRIFDLCERRGIDLEAAIKQKMEYNETRPYRHGGKIL